MMPAPQTATARAANCVLFTNPPLSLNHAAADSWTAADAGPGRSAHARIEIRVNDNGRTIRVEEAGRTAHRDACCIDVVHTRAVGLHRHVWQVAHVEWMIRVR